MSNIGQQQQLESKAANEATQLTQQIAKNNPQQIQAQETSAFVNNLRKNQGATNPSGGSLNPTAGAGSALSPVVGGSARYNADVGNAQTAQEQYGNTTANEVAAVDAAVRQRQNEGLAMNSLATNLNTLGAQSSALNFVNQLRAQAGGQTNPWVSLGTNLLGNAGTSLSKNWPGGVPSTSNSLTGQSLTDIGGGLSQTGNGYLVNNPS